MVRVLEQEGAGADLAAQVVQVVFGDELVGIEENLAASQVRPCLQGSLAFTMLVVVCRVSGTDVLRAIADFTLISSLHFHGRSAILEG